MRNQELSKTSCASSSQVEISMIRNMLESKCFSVQKYIMQSLSCRAGLLDRIIFL